MTELTQEDVRNDALTFADIVVDYFNRKREFTTSISYESKDTVLVKVSNTYKNIKDCKTAELRVTVKPSFVIYYLHYEKYGNFQEDGSFYIEHLSDTVDWLKELG